MLKGYILRALGWSERGRFGTYAVADVAVGAPSAGTFYRTGCSSRSSGSPSREVIILELLFSRVRTIAMRHYAVRYMDSVGICGGYPTSNRARCL